MRRLRASLTARGEKPHHVHEPLIHVIPLRLTVRSRLARPSKPNDAQIPHLGVMVAEADRTGVKPRWEGWERGLLVDKRLLNPYGVIAVNPKRHSHVKYDLAMKYVTFLTSPEGQRLIGSFRVKGKQLFHPSAGSKAGKN